MGSQLATSQSVTNNTLSGVFIDAELLDTWNGHRQNSNGGNYYAPIQGIYLCQAAIAYPGLSSGMVAAVIQTVSGGGGLTFIGGQRVPPRASPRNNQPYAAFLLAQTQILGWGNGDFVGPAAFQNTGGAVTLVNLSNQFPWFSARLVSQGTTSSLPVPPLTTFPSPPTVLSSTFMNTNVRDTVKFLVNPPVFQAFYSNSASLASQTTLPATGTLLGMNNTYVDNYTTFSGTVWTAPVAGIYFCYAQVALTTNTGAQAMAAGLTVTSSNYNSGTTFTYWGGTQGCLSSTTNVAVTKRRLRLNANDTLSLAGFYRDSGAAAATVLGAAPWQTTMFTVWESA